MPETALCPCPVRVPWEGGAVLRQRLPCRGGELLLTCYPLFPGISLTYRDVHAAAWEAAGEAGCLTIHHCREGRMEYSPGNDRLAYTAAGDMKLDLRQQHTGTFVFPSHHYHGLTVAFDRDIVQRSLPQEVRDFPVTPETVIARWELGACPRVVHGAEAMERIFGELYRVPEQIRIPYFKVKILELLLCLDAMPIPAEGETPYFCRTQVEKVKAIHAFLREHVGENFTQEALSRRFAISMTPMKTCFRSVYGMAIGTWLTQYRMDLAAELLRQRPELSIAEIGGQVGYDNAGKFTEAFKRVMHFTPSEDRKERGIRHET